MSTATLSATSPLAVAGHSAAVTPATAPKTASKGWLVRFYDAMVESRMRQARREISYYLQALPQDELNKRGYRVTDRI